MSKVHNTEPALFSPELKQDLRSQQPGALRICRLLQPDLTEARDKARGPH